jgi:REP element-mobilizing transposase RayT
VTKPKPNRHRFHGRELRKGRHSGNGHTYLVTTVTRERLPIFVDWHCATACARELHRTRSEGIAGTLAWVVMPDHVHWLFELRTGDLAGVLRRFKGRAARSINVVRGMDGPVWQRSYHDHAVRREEDCRTLARYVVSNPVRAGICESVGEYPFWDAVWLPSDRHDNLLLPE